MEGWGMNRLRTKRTRFHLWMWAAGFLILALLVYTIASLFTAWELQSELRKIRAAGEPLTLTEAAPKPVAASRNAAVLYQRAYNLLPSREAWDLLGPVFSTRPEDEAKVSWAEVERFLARHREAIALLERAAKKPECCFPVDWEARAEALVSHLAPARPSVRLLIVEAVADARQGRTAEAMSAIETALRFSAHIGAEPTVLAQLFRYACEANAVRALNRVMEIHPASPADSERMFNLLASIDHLEPFVRAIKVQRCFGLSAFAQARKDPRLLWEVWELPRRSPWAWRAARRGGRPFLFLWQPFLNKDEVFYLRSMAKQISMSRLPYREGRRRIEELDKERERLPRYALATRLAMPVFVRASAARDSALAWVGLAQWELAINVFRTREGRWPNSLDQVRHTVGWKLPVDPFSGKDFHYRLEPGGYLLYSIGENLRDDGGREWCPGGWTRGDVIWRVRAPRGS
jgi:hypothetical protein